MKNYVILVLIALASCSSIKQEKRIDAEVKTVARPKPVITGKPVKPYRPLNDFNKDSLKYIHVDFLNRKVAYVSKPLRVLLNDLEIPINSYLIGSAGDNPNIITTVTIKFYNDLTIENKVKLKINPKMLIISWNNPLPSEKVFSLGRKSQGIWTKEVEEYFGNQIVGDVDIVKYNF